MEAIFHEKQDGSLCAQHCLNSLLQGAYFTPIELSSLALSMDEAERLRMAECGEESEEYQRFLRQPSGNLDDSGYFSVDHWFTIRKLGDQWFNLNSLLKRPQLISDTYLALFLAQLKNDGYSIFVVFGELPDCDADRMLRLHPVVAKCNSRGEGAEDDSELQAALRMSLNAEPDEPKIEEYMDADLQAALQMSLQGHIEDEDDDALLKRAIHMSLDC